MRIAALISGGKDGLYALYLASKQHKPACVVAIKSENPESYMFHTPNIDLVKLQARAMSSPLIFKTTKGEKEKELEDLKSALAEAKDKYRVEGVISGAILSNYQKERIESLCSGLNLESITPLWKKSPMVQWREMLKAGFRIVISAVAAEGLGKEWLGKEIGEAEFLQLCNLHRTCYVCTGGEGGEFESLVIDCPLFKQRLRILKSEARWDEKTQSGELVVIKAKLAKKL